MDAAAARICLWIFPALIVTAWGYVNRNGDVPFLLVPIVIFATAGAIGSAATTVPRKTLGIAAAIGGVGAIIPGLPLAVFAMLPDGATHVSVGFAIGSDGDATALTWVLFGLLMIVAAVTICWGAVLLGTTIRRSENST